MTVQYRVAVAKKDERVEGSDDAEVVFSSTLDVVVAPGFDATVEFMRGRVKGTGHSGRVLDALRSGEATAAFARLADAAR